MTTPLWLRENLNTRGNKESDVVIVGGGFAGLSTAYWLTELSPGTKITIVEKSSCGSGASGRNAGFLTMGSAAFYKSLHHKWGQKKAKDILSFARQSLSLVEEHILRKNSHIGFVKSSSMTLIRNESQIDLWKSEKFNPEDFEFSWKNSDSLPGAIQKSFIGGFEASPEYKINPSHLISSLKRMLQERGVEIKENQSAFSISDDVLKTEIENIKASKIILALNAYLPQFHHSFKDIVVPRRAQMISVQLEEPLECPSLYYDPMERAYWRKINDNTLILGGKRLLDEAGETGDFEKISPLIQDGLELYLKEQLRIKYKVISRWSGIMGFTEHELPFIGKMDSLKDEIYMLGGFSGHGMGFGFHSGKEMAEIVIGRKKESFFDQFKRVDIKL